MLSYTFLSELKYVPAYLERLVSLEIFSQADAMISFDARKKIFSGEKFPQIYHDEVPLGQVLLYKCLQYPDKVIQICIDDDVKLTCGQMSDLMKRVAIKLQKFDLKFGDVVGFVSRNSTFLAPAVLGCVLLGLPINPLSVFLEVEDIALVYKQTKPKLIFCDSDQVEKIEEVLRTLKIEMRIVTLDGKLKPYDYVWEYFQGSVNMESFESIPRNFHMNNDKICAAILATSGSTGVPKRPQISQAQMLQSLSAFNGFIDNTLLLNDIPPFWIVGFGNMIHGILNQHARVITAEKFSFEKIATWIKKYRPTQFGLAATLIPDFIEYLRTNPVDMSSIKLMRTGGWSVSERIILQMESFLPNGRLIIMYGMTETGGIVARTDISQPSSAAVGKLCPNVQARVLLEDENFGGIGDVGEILLKLPFNFLGYLNIENQTKSFIDEDSWIHTSDIGYFDGNLNLYLVGRKNLMIRCQNHLVSPIQVEDIIEALPGVHKVVVIALPDFYAEEVACAVVERTSASMVTDKEIISAVSHLEEYKQLKGGVVFLEKLQFTATGKLNRTAIAKEAMSMLQK